MRAHVPLSDFADAMMHADDAFAAKVRAHETRFGHADGMRAVLAQAAYNCWYHVEYRANLREICRAIGEGKPTSLALCGQVTAVRRAAMDAYLVGLRAWLGHDLPPTPELDSDIVTRVRKWLGEDHPAKRALVELLLCALVDQIVSGSHVSVLADGSQAPGETPCPNSSSYLRADGARYTLSDGEFVSSRKTDAERHFPSEADAEALIAGVLSESQPPCMHRYTRYLDIKIASIGALRWRGGLPADDGSKARWEAFWRDAEEALRGWVDGAAGPTDIASELYALLGEPTEERRAVVQEFLLEPPPGTAFWGWLAGRR
ncbi:hypothetical protein HN371_21370 [Candidatus Poribacteria bacterium]|jgi:hypothetical protein|nr:hypothetical protein [Candidatus Poribacteria bacterium]MBT5535159.1 hypothetical protein [Candidatus Poribacteria bacterium]MBT5713675.1 hypothetical protein [Candidatus Poribacteria bacterium]MBT7809098.1 hypothetical protein [Candidatus Poribacteria bacterium]